MTKSIGNYQVIRQLGEGHYGTVYLAVGEVPARGPKPPRRRIVAIKTLREDADEEAMALLCLLYTSPSPRDATLSRMPSSA